MPRICGITDGNPELTDIDRLASGLAIPSGWQKIQSGSFVWLGTGQPNIAMIGEYRAVTDGIFFNRDEIDALFPALPPPQNDSERLINLFRRYGIDGALVRINGDFAIALFDGERQTLYLARDRMGARPLYYSRSRSGMAFASLPGALAKFASPSPQISSRYVAAFGGLHYRYIDNRLDETPFADVTQLTAAHYLTFSVGETTCKRYWSLEDSPDHELNEEEMAEHYRALLIDAVSRRVAASEAQAFTLSGGLDSSTVLSLAARTLTEPQAYSTVYRDLTYDESPEIRQFLADTGITGHYVEIEFGDVDIATLLDQMTMHHQEPVPTVTYLSHFLLCKSIGRQGHRSIFGGLGGDEINVGEYEYFPYFFADLKRIDAGPTLMTEIDAWAKHHDHPIFRKNLAEAEKMMLRLTDSKIPGRNLPDVSRMLRYASTIDPAFFEISHFSPVMDHPFASHLRNRTWQDMSRETLPCCLRAEDRNSNAFGLERIAPFLDHRLSEFMFRVPIRSQIREGATKILLRQAMHGILPEATRTRIAKTGWNAPAHRWFAQGRNAEFLTDLIASKAFRERGIWNVDEVRRLLAEHKEIVASGQSRENHMMFFWQLLSLESWLKAYS
jgi:asparagine synthase (glutamine-hydrolysing)